MWSVCQLQSAIGSPQRAILNLERQGFKTLYPTYTERQVRRNRVVTVEVPVFSFYMFVEILDDSPHWPVINNTFGCRKLLVRKAADGYNAPSDVSSFVRQLIACSSSRNADNGQCQCLLHPGVSVTILRGPLAGRHAIVESSSGDRVKLLLNVIGRDDVTVTVDSADVVGIARQ